jgi:hypothetical protein
MEPRGSSPFQHPQDRRRMIDDHLIARESQGPSSTVAAVPATRIRHYDGLQGECVSDPSGGPLADPAAA